MVETKIEVRNVRTLQGNDGLAYNCSLYVDDKKVADVHNDGNGGCNLIRFSDRTTETWYYDYAKTLPPHPYEHGDLEMDGDFLVSLLVEEHEEDKRMRKLCKRSTLVHMLSDKPGTFSKFNRPYTPEFATNLRTQFTTDIVEIINERYLSEATR